MPDPYRINITPRAQADLESIFEYIRQDSPQNAARVIDQLLAAVAELKFLPARFRQAGRSRKHGNPVHARVVRPFIIYYRIDDPARTVFITEFRHGARRQPRRFD
jgi:addiction module RelE/StbE family toxin